jgi:putative intracellular protease/amidase
MKPQRRSLRPRFASTVFRRRSSTRSSIRHVTTPDGRPLVEGKQVTGFTNSEEAAVGLTEIVPFLVEDELKARGGIYSKSDDWAPYVVTDGLLITGQNPASSSSAAATLMKHPALVAQ